MNSPTVSIIIPTYNRKDSLLRTLESLSRQTYSTECFEVIVVDDGSSDDTRSACADWCRFMLRYVQQAHLGGTAAKNRGAIESQNDLLIFLDDDITVNPFFVEILAKKHQESVRAIIMGDLRDVHPNGQGSDHVVVQQMGSQDCREVTFVDCLGGFFSIARDQFMALGMLQDPAPGDWPNWEDIDLAYRAHLQGFRFFTCFGAIGYHWDHVLINLETQCNRWERASRTFVKLVQRHPDLKELIPMFRDKGPILWKEDPPTLILRKLARQVVSSRPAMWFMESLVTILERRMPASVLLRLLYRWIVSGYIYKGYRAGLRDLAL